MEVWALTDLLRRLKRSNWPFWWPKEQVIIIIIMIIIIMIMINMLMLAPMVYTSKSAVGTSSTAALRPGKEQVGISVWKPLNKYNKTLLYLELYENWNRRKSHKLSCNNEVEEMKRCTSPIGTYN
jgi:hypothetical protein